MNLAWQSFREIYEIYEIGLRKPEEILMLKTSINKEDTAMISAKEFAHYCDIGDMRVIATKEDTKFTCDVAKKYGARSIFGLKCYADYMAEQLKGSGVQLEFSICNNAGSDDTQVKVAGAKRYLEMGLDEVEMYMNFSYLKSGMYKEAEDDIRAVRNVMPKDMILKVIVQAPLLNDEELATASKIVIAGGADYVKTNNGEYGWTTPHHVEVISKAIEGTGKLIKASVAEKVTDYLEFLNYPLVERFGMSTQQFIECMDYLK